MPAATHIFNLSAYPGKTTVMKAGGEDGLPQKRERAIMAGFGKQNGKTFMKRPGPSDSRHLISESYLPRQVPHSTLMKIGAGTACRVYMGRKDHCSIPALVRLGLKSCNLYSHPF